MTGELFSIRRRGRPASAAGSATAAARAAAAVADPHVPDQAARHVAPGVLGLHVVVDEETAEVAEALDEEAGAGPEDADAVVN